MNSSRLVLGSSAVAHRSLVASAARRTALRPAFGLSSGRLQARARAVPRAEPLIFIALRSLSTETTPSTGGSAGPPPPPGFNIEEAKKPLPADKTAAAPKSAASSSPAKSAARDAAEASTKEVLEANIEEADKAREAAADQLAVSKEKKEGEAGKKVTVWGKVKHGVQHFWDGTKLLGAEIKISWRLAKKMALGYELSRRERRQLERTLKDLGRLVPFSVFIIVPAGELFLPIALKLFPNLLPSTYEDKQAKDAKAKKLRMMRKDVSDFLRTTMKEGGIPLSAKTRQREEFREFFKKIRSGGAVPTREELIKVCKIFRDDVTLDNLSRPQLVGMCRYMNLNTFGTDAMLRYSIRHRMRQIKRDDRAISFEGIDSLTVPELQLACAARGIRSHGVSPARLREDLATWLELRLKHGLPSTLLVMANAFLYSRGKEEESPLGGSHYDALLGVLNSIPDELFHEIDLEVAQAEGAATNKQRLEVLREQQELIDEENEQHSESHAAGKTAPKDDQDIDEDATRKAEEAEEEVAESKAAAPGEAEAENAVKQAEKEVKGDA